MATGWRIFRQDRIPAFDVFHAVPVGFDRALKDHDFRLRPQPPGVCLNWLKCQAAQGEKFLSEGFPTQGAHVMSGSSQSQAGILSRRGFFRWASSLAAALGAGPLVSSAQSLSLSAASSSTGSSPAAPSEGEDYYAKLGVPTIINAAGTYTTLTAACMPRRFWGRCRRRRFIRYVCTICSSGLATTSRGVSAARARS